MCKFLNSDSVRVNVPNVSFSVAEVLGVYVNNGSFILSDIYGAVS